MNLFKKAAISLTPLICLTIAWMVIIYIDVVVNYQQQSIDIKGIHIGLILTTTFLVTWLITHKQFEPQSPDSALRLFVACCAIYISWIIVSIIAMIYWHTSIGGSL